MFYEKLAEAKKPPSRLEEAGQGLRAFAPGILGVPALGQGLVMLADPSSNATGKGAGGALALGGSALLYKGIRDSLRVKRENKALRRQAKQAMRARASRTGIVTDPEMLEEMRARRDDAARSGATLRAKREARALIASGRYSRQEKLAEAKEEKRRRSLGEDHSMYTRARRNADRANIIGGALLPGALVHDFSGGPITTLASKLVPDDIKLTPGGGFRDPRFRLSGSVSRETLNDLSEKYTRRIRAARVGAGVTAGLIGAGLMKRRADRREREYQARRQDRSDQYARREE